MARFVYRLQKVYELRERQLKEQEQRVVAARIKVEEAKHMVELKKQEIIDKENEIKLLRQNMLTSSHMLMASHDEYIHEVAEKELEQLHFDLERLKEAVIRAEQELAREMAIYRQLEAELKALEKHKAKAKEAWEEEEKRAEQKQLDEVATQRFFRKKLEEQEEADLLELNAYEDSEVDG